MTVIISKNSVETSIMMDQRIKFFKSLLNAGNEGLYIACLCQENIKNKIWTQFKRDEENPRKEIWYENERKVSMRKTEIKIERTGYKIYNSRTGETHAKK